jgi:hypothetical protein
MYPIGSTPSYSFSSTTPNCVVSSLTVDNNPVTCPIDVCYVDYYSNGSPVDNGGTVSGHIY